MTGLALVLIICGGMVMMFALGVALDQIADPKVAEVIRDDGDLGDVPEEGKTKMTLRSDNDSHA